MSKKNVLMIETTMGGCFVKLVQIDKKGKVVATYKNSKKNEFASSQLSVFFLQIIKKAQISLYQLDNIIISCGPGSMTGIKISLAFLYGLYAPSLIDVNILANSNKPKTKSTDKNYLKKDICWQPVSALPMIICDFYRHFLLAKLAVMYLSVTGSGWMSWLSGEGDKNCQIDKQDLSLDNQVFFEKMTCFVDFLQKNDKNKNNQIKIHTSSINIKNLGVKFLKKESMGHGEIIYAKDNAKKDNYLLTIDAKHYQANKASELMSVYNLFKDLKIFVIIQNLSNKKSQIISSLFDNKMGNKDNKKNNDQAGLRIVEGCEVEFLSCDEARQKSIEAMQMLALEKIAFSFCQKYHQDSKKPPRAIYLKSHYADRNIKNQKK